MVERANDPGVRLPRHVGAVTIMIKTVRHKMRWSRSVLGHGVHQPCRRAQLRTVRRIDHLIEIFGKYPPRLNPHKRATEVASHTSVDADSSIERAAHIEVCVPSIRVELVPPDVLHTCHFALAVLMYHGHVVAPTNQTICELEHRSSPADIQRSRP